MEVCAQTIFREDASKPAIKTREMFQEIRQLVHDLKSLWKDFTDPELLQLLIQTDAVLTEKGIAKGKFPPLTIRLS